MTRGVVYEITLPDGAELIGGKPRVEGGQLEGRASKPTLQAFLPNPDVTGDRGQCEWTVQGARGNDHRGDSRATTAPAPITGKSSSAEAPAAKC